MDSQFRELISILGEMFYFLPEVFQVFIEPSCPLKPQQADEIRELIYKAYINREEGFKNDFLFHCCIIPLSEQLIESLIEMFGESWKLQACEILDFILNELQTEI